MPRRAPAAGLFGQRIVVVQANSGHVEQCRSQTADAGRERHGAHQVVVEPHLLERGESPGDVVTVLRAQQLLESLGEAAHHRRRQHCGQSHESLPCEGLDGSGIEGVGLGQLALDLLVRGGLDIGQAGTLDQFGGRRIVRGQGDVPVPPVLIVACPVLIDTAVPVLFGQAIIGGRVVQSHSSAASCEKV